MTQQTADTVRLVLDGPLTMRTIDGVHATLREAIDPDATGTGLSIDCSAATETDLAFVQLLLAARISTSLRGTTLSLASRPAGALLDTLTRGGFQVVAEDDSAFWFAGTPA